MSARKSIVPVLVPDPANRFGLPSFTATLISQHPVQRPLPGRPPRNTNMNVIISLRRLKNPRSPTIHKLRTYLVFDQGVVRAARLACDVYTWQ